MSEPHGTPLGSSVKQQTQVLGGVVAGKTLCDIHDPAKRREGRYGLPVTA